MVLGTVGSAETCIFTSPYVYGLDEGTRGTPCSHNVLCTVLYLIGGLQPGLHLGIKKFQISLLTLECLYWPYIIVFLFFFKQMD